MVNRVLDATPVNFHSEARRRLREARPTLHITAEG